MKTQFFGFLSFVVVSVFATTTNEVLFVDQEGNVSRPEVLATEAQLAANAAAILTAEQKAAAAQAAAREGTNLIQDVIRDITANELVVYRHGYTDAFGVVVVIDPDAKLVICEFKPLDEVDSAGRHVFHLRYALQNSRSVDAKPEVRWHSSIEGGRESFSALPSDQVQSPVSAGSWENPTTGEVYPYSYTIRFSAPTDKSGFFIVNLTADDASGDGWTFDLPNGVTGGFSGDVPFGSMVLSFKGGLLMEVRNVVE
jgi:hypothetical protein